MTHTIWSLLSDPTYTYKYVLEQIILAYLAIARTSLITEYDRTITEEQYHQIITAYHEYAYHDKPLEYILGHVIFDGHVFSVNEATLIPRPETEDMVNSVSSYIATRDQPLRLIDIGAGSGVISIALHKRHSEHITYTLASEISPGAAQIMEKNKRSVLSSTEQDHYHIHIGDLWAGVTPYLPAHDEHHSYTGGETVIVANLPYIPTDTFDTQADRTIKKREPRIAFVGGDDGLDLYRRMIDEIVARYTTQDQTHHSCVLFAEMMTPQAEILMREYADLTITQIATFHANIAIFRCDIGLR